MLQEYTNLIIMGWASSGSTSTSLILANLLNKKFVYAGGMYKEMSKVMGFDPSSPDIIKFENTYGEKWDWLWEHYIIWKLENETNILANTKVAGFIIDPKSNIFSVFITASPEIRSQRAKGDNRTEDIVKRDQALHERWKRVFDIGFLDEEEIREKIDFVISNEELTIGETAFQIYKSMKRALNTTEIFTLRDFNLEAQKLRDIGTKEYYKILENKNLLITHKEIANDWINNFDEDLKNTSKEWQDAVIKLSK